MLRNKLWTLATLALLFSATGWLGCADDDDSSTDDDAADDDDDNDNDNDNDDQSPADDDDNDDATVNPPNPYTPCCEAEAQDVSWSDPGLPAAGDGPFGFVIVEREFIDAERDRTIPAVVYLPSKDGVGLAAEGAPYPVVLVVHGFTGKGWMVAPYAERLATWGYIAVTMDLPYTSPLALGKLSHRESTLDLFFILNTLCCESQEAGTPLYGKLDRARLAAVGHSMGGKLSVLAAVLDGALRAVVGLDPVDGSGPIDFNDPVNFPEVAPDNAPNLTIPTLYLGGSESGTETLGQACAPVEENYRQFWKYSPSPAVETTFLGADHTDFIAPIPADICNVGTADQAVVKGLAKKYTAAFLNYHLRGWTRFKADFAGAGMDEEVGAGLITWREK